ncbi:arylesterase [Puniceibacterium sediminis]|uniref:Acyl-CoA thioesterase-1 n=1 Tax=Puniceibacterium sediminis TaxID=1608407 RepID=A0A238ZBN9_9RHOB|nr:arylesterase [Puniceibacterium sediminis]SNR80502.1 acyl-CoA thioesterase-1 [Puniceibacterium sediminis]
MSLRTYGVAALQSKLAVALLLGWATFAQAEPVEIVALGDSLTAGYGLPREDGFVPQMQAWLRARGHDVTVVNAGVSGDTTAGGLSRVDWSLADSTDGMIVTLGGNDLLRGIDPTNSRANLEGILKVAAARNLPVLLVGLRAPENYGPQFKTSFDAIYPELANQYGTLYFPEFFQGLTEGDRRPEDVRAYMQADGIHPNAEGVMRIVAAMGPSVEALIEQVQD